ncbi:MAG: glycosyltransferase family 39 protein [Candidatus Colwellbacteria bacterium]|nr:glycosyltransferase family 39 protein [Candidatus Colwellbacteria bacterium]
MTKSIWVRLSEPSARRAALIVLIIAAFFRFYNLETLPPGLYPDEAMNGSNAQEALATGSFKVFYPENNGREGLFINIQALFTKVFGDTPVALRSASALFGVLTVIGIFFLARELFKNKGERSVRIAFFSALFAATGIWAVLLSRIGFRANMAPCFLVWSLFFLVKSLPLIKERFGKAMILAVTAGVVFGLGMHSYIAYRATPIIIAIIFFAKIFQAVKEKYAGKFISVFAAFTVASIVVFSPLAAYFISHPSDFLGRTAQVSVISDKSPVLTLLINTAKTLGSFNIMGDFNWRHNYSGDPVLSSIVGALFIIGISTGLVLLFRRKSGSDGGDRFPFVVLFSSFAVSLLPVVASSEGIPHALRAIITIPPAFILAGIGADWLLEKIGRRSKKISMIFAMLLAVFVVVEGYFLYFVRWGSNPNVSGAYNQNFVDIAQEINSLPNSTKKYILVTAGGADVRGWPMPTQTVMFLTDSFIPEHRSIKNIVYIKDLSEIPNEEEGYALFRIE